MQWSVLLNNEFIEVWIHGIVVMGLSGTSILECSPIQWTTQESKFSTYPMLVQALLND